MANKRKRRGRPKGSFSFVRAKLREVQKRVGKEGVVILNRKFAESFGIKFKAVGPASGVLSNFL